LVGGGKWAFEGPLKNPKKKGAEKAEGTVSQKEKTSQVAPRTGRPENPSPRSRGLNARRPAKKEKLEPGQVSKSRKFGGGHPLREKNTRVRKEKTPETRGPPATSHARRAQGKVLGPREKERGSPRKKKRRPKERVSRVFG